MKYKTCVIILIVYSFRIVIHRQPCKAFLDYTFAVKYLLQAKCFKKINSETSESENYSKNTLIC